jgi:hypothetical protein
VILANKPDECKLKPVAPFWQELRNSRYPGQGNGATGKTKKEARRLQPTGFWGEKHPSRMVFQQFIVSIVDRFRAEIPRYLFEIFSRWRAGGWCRDRSLRNLTRQIVRVAFGRSPLIGRYHFADSETVGGKIIFPPKSPKPWLVRGGGGYFIVGSYAGAAEQCQRFLKAGC